MLKLAGKQPVADRRVPGSDRGDRRRQPRQPAPIRGLDFDKLKREDLVTLYARVLLGLVFLATALTKGLDLPRFCRQVESLAWAAGFPEAVWIETAASLLAVGMALFEVVIAASLLTGFKARSASIASVFLLIFFAIVIAWAWLTEATFDCGCFGALVSRTAQEGIVEDILLLFPALVGSRSTRMTSDRKGWFTIAALIGAVWCWFFYLYPLPSAALRKGMKPRLPDGVEAPQTSRHFFWYFDPDCDRCQRQISIVQKVTGGGAKLTGITRARPGKIEEFKIDFSPAFEIVQATEDQYRDYGFHDGTMIEIKGGKITRLWHGYELKSESAALSVKE